MPNQPTQGVLILPDYAPADFTIKIVEALKAQGFAVAFVAARASEHSEGVGFPALHVMRLENEKC